MARVSILLTAVAFLITAALIIGMVGFGTTSPSMEIRDWHDLDAVRNNLGGNYTLLNDLDSTTAGYEELASGTANQGKGWQPIGAWEYPFSGSLDGQGYEIGDLFINRPDENLIGLFGIVGEGGVIENLGVVNADVTGEGGVGGLVGYNEGTASNSYFTGNVTGYHHQCVGGLVGQNCGPVTNCYAMGSVTGYQCVGGLVGDNFDTVSSSYSTGSVTGEDAAGGLVGQNVYGTLSNSYSTGSVSGNDRVGGLVGTNIGTVSDSYSSGSVTGYSRVGGLGGWNTGTVSNSYCSGSVTGEDTVGGLVGDNVYGTASNSFWDIETSGQGTSDGGTGKTTAEMRDIATFSGAGWEICAVPPGATNPAYIWNIVDHETYPFLTWQAYTPITLDQYSSTVIPGNGLSLTLSLNSTTYHPGEQVTVTIHEKNTLAVENNIHPANRWAIQGLNLGPCGTLNYPFGISIVQGYYDAKDVVDVAPLQLFDPNAFPLCPIILAGIVSYDFQPGSDIAVIHTSWDSEPGAIELSINMTAKVTSAGFWTGSRPTATFSNFTPGIYTVVGGDEWAALVILHFTIA